MEKKIGFTALDQLIESDTISALILAEEAKRKNLAHAMHNDISSALNVISLHCALLNLPDLPEDKLQEFRQTIITYVNKAVESCNEITYSLLAPTLEKFGFVAGLEELCSKIRKTEGINIDFTNHLDFDFSDNQRHLHIFRILEELLVNSIQHGKASHISVQFQLLQSKKSCTYKDNGIGFEISSLPTKSGMGLRNIMSRIALLEGDISIESQIGNGISVVFNF